MYTTDASLLTLFQLGFTPSKPLSEFLTTGYELWSTKPRELEPRTWIDSIYPTGSVVRIDDGLIGVVHQRHDQTLSFLVPDLRRGTWSQATVAVDRAKLEAVHSTRTEATGDEQFREALGAMAMRSFVTNRFAYEMATSLSNEFIEFLFLLEDEAWLIFVLQRWYLLHKRHPFLERVMNEVIVPGLLHRHDQAQRPSRMANILLQELGTESKHPRLMTVEGDYRTWLQEYLTPLSHSDLRRLWDECDAMKAVQNRFDNDNKIVEAIIRITKKP